MVFTADFVEQNRSTQTPQAQQDGAVIEYVKGKGTTFNAKAILSAQECEKKDRTYKSLARQRAEIEATLEDLSLRTSQRIFLKQTDMQYARLQAMAKKELDQVADTHLKAFNEPWWKVLEG